MKLKDLRPCDWCNKQLAGRMPDGRFSIQFYVVTLATAILNTRALDQHIGLATMLGSHALADVMGTQEDAANIVEDQPGAGGRNQALLCFDCWAGVTKPGVHLASLAERLATRKEAAAEMAAATANAQDKNASPPAPAPKKKGPPKRLVDAPAQEEEQP